MRVAIINNGKRNPQKLLDLLIGHDVQVFGFEDARGVLSKDFDLIVLSGSSHMAVMHQLDELAPELDLIRSCSTPLLGVCFGAELLAVAYGGSLREREFKQKGIFSISAAVDDPLFQGRTSFEVYEAHRWVIDRLPDELEVLASSDAGPEILRHRTKPQYGFQFHPEKMCDETYGDELFRSLLSRISASPLSTPE